MIFHGPILNHVGTKPLYSARTPSFLIVYMKHKIILLKENIFLKEYKFFYKAIYLNQTINTAIVNV